MSPSPDDLAAQFAELAAAAAAAGTVARTILLADRPVRFEATDPAMLDAICGPMRHLPLAEATEPAATVRVVRRRDLDGAMTWRWAWQRPRYDSDGHTFFVMTWMGFLVAEEVGTARTVIVVDDSSVELLGRPETTRPVLESVLGRSGLVSVHGGTVGDDDHCVLLTGRGGSGKSSLVAEALHRGYRTVGDDFLYLEPGPDPVLHSAYATVKLAPSSPAARLLDPAIPLVDGKRLGWLPDLGPGAVVARQRPVAIVVPTVGDEVWIGPVDEHAVLTALLPSSVAMSTDRSGSTRELAALARSLPCYALTVAGDADAALAALDGIRERGAVAG